MTVAGRALCLLLAAACRAPPPPSGPDVLLVTIDTLRADRTGPYGYAAARTPTLDALAARGVTFVQATTPFPRTTPALASLLTGLRPSAHGSREVGDAMTTAAPTLAEVLSVRGYRTVALSASRAATARHGLARGFDVFEVQADATGDALTRRALELVGREAGAAPLFFWVHYVDPHHPYEPPGLHLGPDDACSRLHADLRRREHRLGLLYGNHGGEAAAALPACSAHYDAEIAYVDAAVGALFAGLGERAGRALVVLTSDHGEQLGEAGLFYEHGPTVHDASLRVPLLVAAPGVAPGHRDAAPARLEDVAPTVLAWLGVPAAMRPAASGEDLSPRLRGEPVAANGVALAESGSALHPTLFGFLRSGSREGLACVNLGRRSWCAAPGAAGRLYDHAHDPWLERPLDDPAAAAALAAVAARWPPEGARERTARTARFKLVERPAAAGGYARRLYDLAADPAETKDVAALHADEVARLGAWLDAFTAELPAAAPKLRAPDDLEALRQLGYVE